MVISKFSHFLQRLVIFSICASVFILSSCSRLSNKNQQQPVITSVPLEKPLKKISSTQSQLPLKAALLIPLTGQHSKLGHAVEQAAELALFNKKIPNFDLAIYDTKSTVKGAQDAFNKAMLEKCTVIVGPIFSDDISAIKNLATQRSIPILSLSNNMAIANNNTYILGLSPIEQAMTMLEYAIDNGIKDIVTILPQNELGQAIASEIQKNAHLSKIAFYNPQQINTLEPLIQQIKSGHINGLLIPEGGTALARIIAALVYAEVDLKNIQLLGSSLWDEPAIRNNQSLQGAWITNTDQIAYKNFENEFKKNYGYVPSRIASVGYDAIALLITAKKHFDDQATSHTNLTDPRGYVGANGVFKLSSKGLVQRTYKIVRLNSPVDVQTPIDNPNF